MSRAALLELLRQRIGLDGDSLGERVIDDACAQARHALAVADDAQLVRRMTHDPAAFATAAEHFLVPESWFFRAPEQFDDLVRFARDQRDRRPLRVLSVPCASGEEAYSAVIHLLEAGLPPADIDVLGIDLSETAIARARAGRYRHNALRGQPLAEPWMQECAGGFEVVDTVRQCARFRAGNALDDAPLRDEVRFDVVFCRNLLIYLHGDARQRLLDLLRRALAEPGLLLAGQAEVVSTMHADFQPVAVGSPLSFRLRSRAAEVPAVASAASDAAPARKAVATRSAPPPAVPPPVSNKPPTEALAHARALADAGQLEAAHAGVMRWLARHPTDSEGFYLLGLLESALGRLDAADEAFTRVLYLRPDHDDALAQRIGLAERAGRAGQARDLRARATRLRHRQGKK